MCLLTTRDHKKRFKLGISTLVESYKYNSFPKIIHEWNYLPSKVKSMHWHQNNVYYTYIVIIIYIVLYSYVWVLQV